MGPPRGARRAPRPTGPPTARSALRTAPGRRPTPRGRAAAPRGAAARRRPRAPAPSWRRRCSLQGRRPRQARGAPRGQRIKTVIALLWPNRLPRAGFDPPSPCPPPPTLYPSPRPAAGARAPRARPAQPPGRRHRVTLKPHRWPPPPAAGRARAAALMPRRRPPFLRRRRPPAQLSARRLPLPAARARAAHQPTKAPPAPAAAPTPTPVWRRGARPSAVRRRAPLLVTLSGRASPPAPLSFPLQLEHTYPPIPLSVWFTWVLACLAPARAPGPHPSHWPRTVRARRAPTASAPGPRAPRARRGPIAGARARPRPRPRPAPPRRAGPPHQPLASCTDPARPPGRARPSPPPVIARHPNPDCPWSAPCPEARAAPAGPQPARPPLGLGPQLACASWC
jgi:hypothetical protein